MVLIESLLTTFQPRVIYWGSLGISEKCLENKTEIPEPNLTKLGVSKPVKPLHIKRILKVEQM